LAQVHMHGTEVRSMPQRVVIVGGGVCGHDLVNQLLAKKLDIQITLVRGMRFAEWSFAIPHVLAHPELHHKALAENPTNHHMKGVDYLYGVASGLNLEKKELVVAAEGDKQVTVHYDTLILAVGFRMPVIQPEVGCTLDERKAEVQSLAKAIRDASHVLIGGGGPIALELAGSVRVAYKDKRVTLLCKSIVPQWPDSARGLIESQLKEMKIDVHSVGGRCPLKPELTKCKVNDIDGDVYIPSFSQGPATQFLESSGLLDDSGRVKVSKHLCSTSSSDVFAVGCSDFPRSMHAMPKLGPEVQTVVQNIVAQMKAKPLSEHTEAMPTMKYQPVLSIGFGKDAWAYVDFTQMPMPVRVCCCEGRCGFPFCPLPCCWPVSGCCMCGYCCGPPHGNGMPKFFESKIFDFGGQKFPGMGEGVPAQQTMEAAAE